jgi:hypothetical protein
MNNYFSAHPQTDPILKMTMLIALSVRNEMEDFHCKHLSDEQMKELNPIIRQGIYNMLAYLNVEELEQT